MKFTFPLKTHSGLEVRLHQTYGNKSNSAWYKANGINAPFHSGIDISLSGTEQQSYGSELICPFESATVVKTTFDTPLSTKGNGVTIQSGQFVDNGITKMLQVVFWHASELNVTLGQRLSYGDTVCFMGNSGLVRPAPTISAPYSGTHCHLMVFEYRLYQGNWLLQNEGNGVHGAADPLLYFDINNTLSGKDTSEQKDTAPLIWVIEKLQALIAMFRK